MVEKKAKKISQILKLEGKKNPCQSQWKNVATVTFCLLSCFQSELHSAKISVN